VSTSTPSVGTAPRRFKWTSELGAATPTPRPVALKVLPGNIPVALKDRDHWVVWRYVWVPPKGNRQGKWDKPPFRTDGRPASSTDAGTWTSFASALAAYERGGWDGIGRVPTPDEKLVVGDADKCRDPGTGATRGTDAAALLEIGSYTEASPSGTGLRLFAYGEKPGRHCKKGHF
jgi:putative DNA primase/helicase